MSEEFIRGVDEDLRHKQLGDAWRKYGSYVIAFLIGIILFVAGNVTLKNYNESHYADVANQYARVEQNVAANDLDEALGELESMSDTDVGGYQILVAFRTADIELEKGETDKAIAALDKLSNMSGVDRLYRDLATLKAAMIAMDTASYDDIKMRLAPLMIVGNNWEYMARELLAMAAVSAGKGAEARRLLTEVEQDLEAPEVMKRRAKELKSVIE